LIFLLLLEFHPSANPLSYHLGIIKMSSSAKNGDMHGLLTNVEVMALLASNEKERASTADGEGRAHTVLLQNRLAVERQTLHYISTYTPAGAQNMDSVKKCLSTIKALDLGLTEAELLMIANLVPTSEVELYTLLEDITERGIEGHIQRIIDIVRESFGLKEATTEMDQS